MIPPMTLTITHDGRPLEIGRPGSTSTVPSFFALGLPKAGSTLLDKLVTGLCQKLDIPTFSLDTACYKLGLKPRDIPAAALDLFSPTGFGYTGFRTVPVAGLPAFASGRTVALVRDPRDMVVSLFYSLGFSHKPPGTAAGDANKAAFEAERASISQADINAWVVERADTTAGLFNRLIRARQSHDIRVWRYEDVVFEKHRWAREMLDTLGFTLDDDVLRQVVADVDIVPQGEDPARHIRKVTPGDHIEKLTPQTIEILNQKFARTFREFGYS